MWVHLLSDREATVASGVSAAGHDAAALRRFSGRRTRDPPGRAGHAPAQRLRPALLDVGLGVGLGLRARPAELVVAGLVALAVGMDADGLVVLLRVAGVVAGVLVTTLHGRWRTRGWRDRLHGLRSADAQEPQRAGE